MDARTIRKATAEDRAGIASVHIASIHGLTRSHYTQAQIAAWSAGKSPEKYPVNDHLMFVAVQGDEIVGFSELRVCDQEVRAVYVAPKVARQGIGSRLLQTVEEAAKQFGLKRIQLGASINAVPFYKLHGFQETGEGYKTTADGAPYQEMEKFL